MKTLVVCAIGLACWSFCDVSSATTTPGQACQAVTGALTYSFSGATNATGSTIQITCPASRPNDGGSGPVAPVIYFVEDGQTKLCVFHNFNIDTGMAGLSSAVLGTRRLVVPTLSSTLPFSPFAFTCLLPPGSKVTGYFTSN